MATFNTTFPKSTFQKRCRNSNFSTALLEREPVFSPEKPCNRNVDYALNYTERNSIKQYFIKINKAASGNWIERFFKTKFP